MSETDELRIAPAWWDDDRTMALVETGIDGVQGTPDDDSCRAMASILNVTGEAGIAGCADFLARPGWWNTVLMPESWLTRIGLDVGPLASPDPGKPEITPDS